YKNKYNQKFNNDYKNKDKMKFDDENKNSTMILEYDKISEDYSYEVNVKDINLYSAVIETGTNAPFISLDVLNKEKLSLKCKPTLIKQAVCSFRTLGNTSWKVK
ncbi:hypothetical protein DMUE_5654, partial [Dictyocoela muelleri]